LKLELGVEASILVGVLENEIVGIGFEWAGFEPAGSTELPFVPEDRKGDGFPFDDDLEITNPAAGSVEIHPSRQPGMVLSTWQKALHPCEIHRSEANPEFELMVPYAAADEDVFSQSRR
jgi:hypothetical protein